MNGRFVADLASGVVDLLAARSGEHILDVGCGDGALTEKLATLGAIVTGIDASANMIAAARARGLDVHHLSATDLASKPALTGRFDAVFSNAALHWIPAPDQPRALLAIRSTLKPRARFIAEMGGQGNIAAIRTALSAILAPLGIDAEAIAASFFPSQSQYRDLLEQAGFVVHSIDLIPRPTPLLGGRDGMAIWLNTFRNGVLDRLKPGGREKALKTTVDLLRPILSDPGGDWTADYVRLRFHASVS